MARTRTRPTRALSEVAYTELAPPPDLAPVVDRFWWSATRGDPRRSHRVLPDGCVDVLVDVHRGEARLVGPMTRAVEVPGDAADVLAVRLLPGTAARLARSPLDALADRDPGLDELGLAAGPRGGALVEQVAEAHTRAERLAVLIGWLRARLAAAPPPDRLVARAIAWVTAVDAPRVEAIAAALGVSRQHLARAFRREVGLSPKALARIARTQRATAALGRGAPPAAVAAGLGYFDQAHLAGELRALVGLSPSAIAPARLAVLDHLYPSREVPFLQAGARRAP